MWNRSIKVSIAQKNEVNECDEGDLGRNLWCSVKDDLAQMMWRRKRWSSSGDELFKSGVSKRCESGTMMKWCTKNAIKKSKTRESYVGELGRRGRWEIQRELKRFCVWMCYTLAIAPLALVDYSSSLSLTLTKDRPSMLKINRASADVEEPIMKIKSFYDVNNNSLESC